MENVIQYQVEDWVVHRNYGIGQITKIEAKPINGEIVDCYKVEIRDGAYWIPTDNTDNPRIRPVATNAALQKALKILKKPVPIDDSDRKIWKQRIEDARTNGGVLAISKLVRDLTVLSTLRKRNQTEDEALSFFTERLLNEWVISTGEAIERARPKLEQCLQICSSQASLHQS